MALTGCGDNNIDIVKNYTLPIKKSMTIGAAVDGYKGCQKVKWEDVSGNDLKLVKVTCEVSSDVLKAEFDKQSARYEEAVQKSQRRCTKKSRKDARADNKQLQRTKKPRAAATQTKRRCWRWRINFANTTKRKQRKIASVRP